MAIGPGAGHGGRGQRAGRAGPALDRQRLAQVFLQRGLQSAGDDVGAATGREADQQGDGAGGPGLRTDLRHGARWQQGRCGQQVSAAKHAMSP